MSNPLVEATSTVMNVLSPLESQERIRVVQAVLTLLGENPNVKVGGLKEIKGNEQEVDGDGSMADIHQGGKAWAVKNKLTRDQLDQIFHIDQAGIRPIALPGLSKKKNEQTASTYLTQGIACLLSTGEANFTDEIARKLCEHFGCYDLKNHSRNVKDLGNKITGSKSIGWKLTAPGLVAAAELIKQLPENA